MQNRKRITNILIASTLTALVLIVFLAFKGSDETAALETVNTPEAAVVEMIGDYETDIAALQTQIESLQEQNAAYAAQNDAYIAQNDAYVAQNEELRAAVTTLQERESEYQAQIEAANQTIEELSQAGNLAMGEQALGEFPPHGHEHNH